MQSKNIFQRELIVRLPLLLVTLPNVALVGLELAPPQFEWSTTFNDLGPELKVLLVSYRAVLADPEIPLP